MQSEADSISNIESQLALLLKAVRLLASEARDQTAYLKGFFDWEIGMNVDELALNFDDSWSYFEGRRDLLNPTERKTLEALDRALNEMSGSQNSHLWSAEALYRADEWKFVRELATACLKALAK